MKILVVDDNPIVQMALCRMLSTAGHDVCSAADAQEAERLAAAEAFDCVVIEVGDACVERGAAYSSHAACPPGVITARRIRRSGGPSRHAHFVAFTSRDLSALPEEERALFSAILDKPQEVEQMSGRCCWPRQPQTYLL